MREPKVSGEVATPPGDEFATDRVNDLLGRVSGRLTYKALELIQYEGASERFLIFGSDAGPHVQIRFEGEPWFTQAQMAEIFGVDVSVVNRHIQNFLDDNELDESTFANFARVETEGGRQVDGRAGARHSLP